MANILKYINDFIKVKEDEDGRTVNQWKSPDILPVLPKNRIFGTLDYCNYWVSGTICASFWSLGGTAIAYGLNTGEAIGAVVAGSLLCAFIAYWCSGPGTKYHLGFPMMSRATFGICGSFFVVVIKCFTNFLYCGIQSYWGGLAVQVILSAIYPTYRDMRNTLPESAHDTTPALIGTGIYMAIFLGVLSIKPYKMTMFFRICFFSVLITIVARFIWAMVANHGPGNLVQPPLKLTKAETAFYFIQTIGVLCSSFTGASVRHADWSRYARTPKAPLLGMWLAGPLALTFTATFGVFPISLLLHIQSFDYSAAARAGTFFGGLGWFLSQLAVNVSLNSIAAGMDLTSVAPKYLNARRGGFLLATVGLATLPWNYVNSTSSFTTILSSFGLFLSPLIGIYVVDYNIVRRGNWKVPDLYIGNSDSIYWYAGGFNWRAFATWILIVGPSLRKL
ncbi:permease for cytosine/purines, uracil, thiamine, allantoin-domain-containing protein [Xylariaceae sp. FL0255]|nr:permease for cytosine/purines, uracil, thiamine, allantoin-domain-containing protein [Xylariaceae sp. FL0255]